MTFEQIQEVLSNGTTTGPVVGVCNGINALTTATQKTAQTGGAEDLSGLVASVKDASDVSQSVYLTSIDASFLTIVAIAGIMGIQIHNNLKTENPELWEELNNFKQSRYFKTFIASPEEIASRVIQSVEAVEDGAPAILTNSGKLYVSGDMIEQAFSTFKELEFFNRGASTFEFPELPAATTTYTKADFLNTFGTSFAIVEAYYNSIWADLKTALSNRNIDNYNGYEAAAVQSFNSFTDYWAKCRELDSDLCNTIEQNCNFGTIGTQYSSGTGVKIDFETLFTFCTLQQNNITVGFSDYTTEKVWNFGNSSNAFTKIKFTLSLNNGTYTTNTRQYSSYCEVRRYNNPPYPVSLFIDTNAFPISATSESGAPEGITQEEDAVIPSSSDVSFTNWVASNLSTLWDARLISIAPATFNIALHDQNWFNIMLPYSLGYDSELDGEAEEPTGGAITQQDETTTTQQEENETAGIEDTGTNTEDFNAYYDSKEGSQKETQGQEDDGEITDDGVEQMDWNSAGMTGIYCPTDAQMGSISNWLWSTDFTDVVTKYFQDPGEALISLQRCWIPFTLSGGQEVVFGRVGSGISVATANKFQSYNVPGSVTVTKFYNNYLDFEAQASIYVPFAGFQSLDLRDIMGATLNLKYKWDLASGQGVAELWVARDEMSAPLYQWQINCNEQIPCSSANQAQFMLGIANTIASTASAAVGGFATGGPAGAVLGGLTGAAGGLAGLHNSQHVSQGGAIGGNAAAVACKTPFITIRYPKNNTPAGFNEFDGIGIDTVGTLGSFQGFVKCQEVHLQAGWGASKAELDAIEAILMEGVLL